MPDPTGYPELDALLIYSDADGKIRTYVTPGIKERVILEP